MVGCSMMRISESGLETATTHPFPHDAQVAGQQFEMVRQGIGVFGIGAGDDTAGVTLQDNARAFALQMHGFDRVTPQVDSYDGTRCFWHGFFLKQKV